MVPLAERTYRPGKIPCRQVPFCDNKPADAGGGRPRLPLPACIAIGGGDGPRTSALATFPPKEKPGPSRRRSLACKGGIVRAIMPVKPTADACHFVPARTKTRRVGAPQSQAASARRSTTTKPVAD